MGEYRNSIFTGESELCCYPNGSSLRPSGNVRKQTKLIASWVIGMVCVIIAFAHFANMIISWSDEMASRIFHVVYNKAIKFDDCPPGSYMYCPSNKKCISYSQRCDRFQDCPDDRDESNCECLAKEFACRNGRCVSEIFLCDGIADCVEGDDEDETNCGSCAIGYYRCKGVALICLPAVSVCDSIEDCSLGDDEESCVVLRKNDELSLWDSFMNEVNVCYAEWNKKLDAFFCKQVSKGPPIASFPLFKKNLLNPVGITFTTYKNNSIQFKLPHRQTCPKNQVVALKCEQEECGRRKVHEKKFKKFVINGRKTVKGEFPWNVLILCGPFKCGGTLISNRWVLTAAHCVHNQDLTDIMVYLGSIYQADTNWVIHSVQKIIIHEKYYKINLNDDVALLKLHKAVFYTHYIQPICLPYKPFVEKDYLYCASVGFGRTVKDRASEVLLKIRVVKRNKMSPMNRICIGTSAGDKYPNLCMGDSGGGFVCRSKKQDKWTLIAINSYVTMDMNFSSLKGPNAEGCQNSFVTVVNAYMKWIEMHRLSNP